MVGITGWVINRSDSAKLREKLTLSCHGNLSRPAELGICKKKSLFNKLFSAICKRMT